MGNIRSRRNTEVEDETEDPYSDANGHAHSHLSDSQVHRMQELFSRGLNPDIGLLPFQMPRMKVDAPPEAKEKKTVRMKNICYMNKKEFSFNNLGNNKYTLHFEYSSSIPVYCTIYYLATEYTDQSNCTFKYVYIDIIFQFRKNMGNYFINTNNIMIIIK